MKEKAIVLFSDDFRINDNPALFHAAHSGLEIIPLFIYNENYLGRPLGGASKVFLHHVLASFSKLLEEKYDSPLVILKGNVIEELKKLGPSTVFFNRSYTLEQREMEEKLAKTFKTQSFKGKIIFEPGDVRRLQIFTSFWRECLVNSHKLIKPLHAPTQLKIAKIHGLKLNELELLPKNEGNWHEKAIKFWEFDYKKLEQRVRDFATNSMQFYAEGRDFPANEQATSRLSPYLRFGMLSPKGLFCFLKEKSPAVTSQLGWRDFAHHNLYYHPYIATQPIKQKFANFEWNNNANLLKKWQSGETGYEIVDAGMKELRKTGYMHNRVRMITASFLIKDLIIDWRKGEQWFWDELFDACPAVNPFSWQWSAGTGISCNPFFRIFNPRIQQEKFDSEKIYIKKWDLHPAEETIIDHETQKLEVMARFKEI